MRFGVCTSPELSETLGSLDDPRRPDFVEWAIASTVGTISDEEFQTLKDLRSTLPVGPEAWNVLLPGSLKIVGPTVDLDALGAYGERAFARVRALGGEVVVFGSGGARTIPDGWSRDEGERQFVEACRVLAPMAARHGIVLALEPLRTAETNLINSVSEGLRFLDRVGEDGLWILADLYHMEEERESHAVIREAAARLAHVHVAAPGTRTLPTRERDEEVMAGFFRELVSVGYAGRISLECSWDDADALGESLVFLREVWSGLDR